MRKHVLQDNYWRRLLIIATIVGVIVIIINIAKLVNGSSTTGTTIIGIILGSLMIVGAWGIAFITAKDIDDVDNTTESD